MARAVFICAVLALLPGQHVSAGPEVPAVSSVSGVVQTGEILTVTGENLVSEDQSGWLTSAFPGGGKMSRSVSRCEGNEWDDEDVVFWYEDSNVNQGGYSTEQALFGSQSMRFQATNDTYHPAGPGLALSDLYSAAQDMPAVVYSRFYLRLTASYAALADEADYVKTFHDITMGSTNWYFNLDPDWPSSVQIKIVDTYETLPVDPPFVEDRWYCFEIEQDQDDHTMTLWIDGRLVGSVTEPASNPPVYYSVGMINAAPVPVGTFVLFGDGFAWSASRIHPATLVEIGDSADYDSANRNLQELVHVSADEASLRIRADLTGLGEGPYYLWVTNNRQVRSTPYAIGDLDELAPAAPENLQVN